MASNKKNETAVYGVFPDRITSEQAFAALLNHGVPYEDINAMMSNETRVRDFSREPGEKGSKAGSLVQEGAGVGGAVGTVVGASLAALAAIGTSIALPGLGIVIAGPIAAAIAGAGAGALTGGLVGGLVGLGLPEQNAKSYNEALLKGGVVLSVPVRNNKASEVERIMVDNGGKEVCTC